jgi:hypothetical protein
MQVTLIGSFHIQFSSNAEAFSIKGNHDVTSQRSSIGSQAVLPKPILKKSSEDLKPTPILKNRCDLDLPATTGSSSTSSAGSISGGILKRKSVTDSGNETAASRPDHVRIRSPSPGTSLEHEALI